MLFRGAATSNRQVQFVVLPAAAAQPCLARSDVVAFFCVCHQCGASTTKKFKHLNVHSILRHHISLQQRCHAGCVHAALLLLLLPQACVHQDALCACCNTHAGVHTVRCGAGDSSRHRSAGAALLLLLMASVRGKYSVFLRGMAEKRHLPRLIKVTRCCRQQQSRVE